jgi:hypothetical protein
MVCHFINNTFTALIIISRVGYAELASAVSNAGGLGIVRPCLKLLETCAKFYLADGSDATNA